jgi:hypothetical protein
MEMGVYQPWHQESSPTLDHFRIHRREVFSNSGNPVTFDPEIG